jgi:simple sugar transport system ATP-binding protein
MNTAENIVLRVYREKPFSSFGLINKKQVESLAREVVEKLNVLTPDLWSTEVRILSGGNIQRLILGRELWRMPRLVVAFHPTYGLDYKALKQTHNLFMEMRAKGTAFLLISEDIEEIFLLSDRILVMSEGRVVGEMDREKATVEAVGLLMTGMGASGDHSRT